MRAAVAIPIPDEPTPLDELVAYLREVALERSMYPGHAGFMAYIVGSGTVPAAPAELLAAALDQNLGGWRLSPAATEIELHLMRWFAESFGLPPGSGGLMTSGGAMAAFVALKAARDAARWDSRGGLPKGPARDLRLWRTTSSTNARPTEGSVKAGADPWRGIRMRVDALRAIETDIAAGVRPIIVVATAGTGATV